MAPTRKSASLEPKPRRAAESSGSVPVFTFRDLNRATLARQLLLTPEKVTVEAALERVAGLQAQVPGPPNIGLWARVHGFAREQLLNAYEKHTVVRAPLYRGTLHLVSAADYVRFRSVVEPMLHRAFASMDAGRLKGIDALALAEEARPFIHEAPRTQDEVRDFLGARHPKLDVRMVGHAVRLHLPLVQVPERGAGSWDFPSMPRFALADDWIGRPLARSPEPRELIRRYLAAFGPATARDFQTWSGFAAKEAFEQLRPELRAFHDEKGREVFDLPDSPRPHRDTPVPPCFLPEYDNVLLAHADRTRIVADLFRPSVFLPGLRVAATFLVDGLVRGTWKISRAKKAATLTVTPFVALAKNERAVVEAKAEQLARFIERDAATFSVEFVK